MNGNETIRKLLLDENCGEVLELYERCEIKSFLEIEKYYSGGCMELNENNICDILRFSIYYNDNGIMLICKKYLKTHLNDSIIGELLSFFNELKLSQLNDLKEMCEEYIKVNGYNCLNNDEILYKLNLKQIKSILNRESLIIINESWLLNRLLLWYKNVLKNEENDNDEEELNEFKLLLKEKVNEYEIKSDEIYEENVNLLKEMGIEVKDRNNYICIKSDEVKNVELINVIQKYYSKDIEEMEIDIGLYSLLNNDEVKIEIEKLLSNEDIKLIETLILIIVKMRMNEIIPNEMKNRLLSRLINSYNENQRNRTIKCLCLFVDDEKHISTIEDLCGKEILYQILNEEYYLNSKSKELLIQYIQEMKLSEKEEEEMSKIILDEELLSELKTKEISSFSYPHSEYSLIVNDRIKIIPSIDGNRCEFSITPSLPSGIFIDKESGIIHGKVDRIIEKREYEVNCKNMKNEKKFKISLEFINAEFTHLYKSGGTSILNNGKIITNTVNDWNHCYLNLKMENGTYHIKYQFHQNQSNGDNQIMLGLSTDNTYSDNDIFNQSTTCNYRAYTNGSITYNCHIGTIVNRNPNFKNHGDGSIYEIIVDMNKREFWISHNNSSPVLLVKDLHSPLYPYVSLEYNYTSIDLLSFTHQN